MNNTAKSSSSRFSNNQTESRLPGWLHDLSETVEYSINDYLAFKHIAGRTRRTLLIIGISLLWILFVLAEKSIGGWKDYIIRSMTAPIPPGALITTNLSRVIREIIVSFFDPNVLAHLIAIILPLWIAYQVAAVYLADIFEKDIPVAQRFITQAAFAFPAYDNIHVEEGDIRPEDKSSTVIQIGGPGYATVNLENVAVFEKITGACEIVGPTIAFEKNLRTVEGFERLRKVIDLRDQTILINRVTGRTRDGIPVSIHNLRLIFSIQRDTSARTLSRPYPYSSRAVHWLVYNHPKQTWQDSIRQLICRELGHFIAEHNLGELLSSTGTPEIYKQIEQEGIIQKKIWQNQRYQKIHRKLHLPQKHHGPALPYREKKFARQKNFLFKFSRRLLSLKEKSDSVSRNQLRDIFTKKIIIYEDFVRSFPERARQRGIRLEWMDVGTFHTPNEITLAQNMDAWQLTNENIIRSNRMVLEKLKRDHHARELAKWMQYIPLVQFINLHQKFSDDPAEIIYYLIEDYFGLMRAARDRYMESGRTVPEKLRVAIEHIQKYQRNFYQKNKKGTILGK
jgi:hypothetical protein